VGSPATIVLAEAHLKGLMDLSGSLTFAASLAQSNGEATQARRGGVEGYLSQGYVSADSVSGSVSRTLEFAWADHSLARWAASLGDQALSEELRERASGWRLLWDEAQGFLVGRNSNGSFNTLRSDKRWESVYVEGNAWHYLWAVPFDITSLIEVQHEGDQEAFLNRLYTYWSEVYTEPDDLFPDDYYWHGNEPVLHYAWLSSLVGDDALSIEASHHVLATRYDNTPTTGLDGNDDSGTLSAWYVWASVGLYPIAGSTTYALGAPIFERVEFWGDDATALTPKLTINAPGAELTRAPTRRWLGEVLLEGTTLEHEMLMRGEEGTGESEGLVMSVGYGVQE
jgi:predicted alpha-1,2-mannosidase